MNLDLLFSKLIRYSLSFLLIFFCVNPVFAGANVAVKGEGDEVPSYVRSDITGFDFHGEDLRVIKEIIPSDSSVLEIGCGNGNLIGKLNVTKAVGVDVSDKLIELAKKKFPKVSFFCDDINSYSKKLLSKDKFDFILISDTLGYFYDIK